MCILVGASGCGKTSIARTAAQLAGRHLTELALTGGTDTADLLGGFEQLEPKRKIQVCAKLDEFWCMFVPLTKHVGFVTAVNLCQTQCNLLRLLSL